MTDTPESSAQETFISHLVELRDRLLRAIIAVVVVMLALFPWAKDIYAILAKPLLAVLPAGASMIATDVTGTFLVPLKVTAMAAFVIALPYVLWQAWAFVAPGLYQHEKRLAAPVIASSVAMFVLGMAYCYYVVFGLVFRFIANFAPDSVNVAPDIDAYFSFVLGLFLAFGLTFEVPIVVVLLARFGIADVERLKAARPYVIVGAFIVAAIFTPPDVISQLLLAVPLCLLYEVGIQLARLVGKRPESDPAASASGGG